MQEQLARAGEELQQRCAEITGHLDHLRHAILARLPGQQHSSAKADPNLDAFLSLPSPSGRAAAARGRGTPAAPAPAGGLTSKEEVGRATWTFLHTLAAQYPDHPTRQQRRDARTLIDVLTRMYPCGECARHFRAVVAAHPPQVASRAEFSGWMCQVHNVVNRSLDKPTFNCDLVGSRWAGLECDEEEACSLDLGGRGGGGLRGLGW